MNDYHKKIASFYRTKRRMPSYQEIMLLCGFKSKNAAYKLVQKLVAAGAMAQDSSGRLLPGQLWGEVPLLGLVEAGFPTVVEGHELDTLDLDNYLVENKENTYLLEVKGDSMIEAGIQEGDLVLAERGRVAREGDIVIALVDGGWTMKYYRTKNGKPYLLPANSKYQPIYPRADLQIAAVVRGVIRKY